MKRKYQVTFGDYEVFPRSPNVFATAFSYSILDKAYLDTSEAEFQTKHCEIIVEVTSSLAWIWEVNSEIAQQDLPKVMFEYARKHIRQKLIDDSLSERETLTLNTNNADNPKCRYNPAAIKDPRGFSEEIVQEQGQVLMADRGEIEIATRIIDARDNVNALFMEKYSDRLFVPKNERSLLELLRPAMSHEEFVYRLLGLCTLIDDVNIELLRTITGTLDKDMKSIGLIGEYTKASVVENREKISEILKNINRVRQGYPTHTDGAVGFIKAHEFFGLSYPLTDFKLAWKKILLGYDEALQLLLIVVRKK